MSTESHMARWGLQMAKIHADPQPEEPPAPPPAPLGPLAAPNPAPAHEPAPAAPPAPRKKARRSR